MSRDPEKKGFAAVNIIEDSDKSMMLVADHEREMKALHERYKERMKGYQDKAKKLREKRLSLYASLSEAYQVYFDALHSQIAAQKEELQRVKADIAQQVKINKDLQRQLKNDMSGLERKESKRPAPIGCIGLLKPIKPNKPAAILAPRITKGASK